MALNRYDVPAQDVYFNTYAPLPYEQMMATVGARQAQQMKAQDALFKTYEDTQNLTYIPDTKDEQYVRDYVSKVDDLVGKYISSDMSNPIVYGQLRSDFGKITNKQNLQNIGMSYQNWAANNKMRSQLVASGKYSPYLDVDPAKDPNFSSVEGQVYNYTTPEFDTYLPEARQFWGNVKPSLLKDANGNYVQTKEGYNLTGYDQNEMQKYAELNWGSFDQTPVGRAAITHELRSRGLAENAVNRKNIATELLMNERPIGTDITGSRTPEWQARGNGDQDNVFYPTSQEQDIRSDKTFDPYQIGKIDFKDGQVYVAPKYKEAPTSAGYGTIKGGIPGEEIDAEARKIKESEQKARLDFVRKQIPALKDLSDPDTYKAYNDLTKDGRAFPDLPKTDLGDVARNKLALYVADSMTDRDLIVMDDKGSSDIRNTRDNTPGSAMRDLGYDVQSFKEELRKAAANQESTISIGGLANNGPRAGMLELEVKDLSRKGEGRKGNKGQTRKVYITTNQETEAIMSPLKEVYDNVRNFNSGTVPIGMDNSGNTVAVRTSPNVYKNKETGKWEYSYTIDEGYLSNGNFIYVAPTTMKKIKDMQLRHLMKSGYINTNIGFTPTGSLGF